MKIVSHLKQARNASFVIYWNLQMGFWNRAGNVEGMQIKMLIAFSIERHAAKT